MLRRGRTDEELIKYMELVQLSYLVSREGGWNAIADWMDVLSGGEKQRIAVNIFLFCVRNGSYCSCKYVCLFSIRMKQFD